MPDIVDNKQLLKDAVIKVMIHIMENGREVKDLEGNVVGRSDPTAADIQAAMKLLSRDDIVDPTAGKDPFSAAMENVVQARNRSRDQGGKVPPDDLEE